MTEPNYRKLIYQDLLYIKQREAMNEAIVREVSRPAFWIGLGFAIVTLILAVNFMMV